jgi:hypothetical protein
MAAYRRISARIPDLGRLQRRHEAPANENIRCRLGLEIGVVAMQKVEGSNPFSRFASNPCTWATRPSRGNQTTPAYRLYFGH